MIHSTADVSTEATIGAGTQVWNEAQVRERAVVGSDCVIGKGVYIDQDVVVGNRCKIQNRASLYRGLTVGDGVYIGPHVSFTNDRYPRAVNVDGSAKTDDEWKLEPTFVLEGASIGVGAIILPGLTIGRWAMVGASALVTRDVPDHALVIGKPGRLVGHVCKCGRTLKQDGGVWRCPACDASFTFEKDEASVQ